MSEAPIISREDPIEFPAALGVLLCGDTVYVDGEPWKVVGRDDRHSQPLSLRAIEGPRSRMRARLSQVEGISYQVVA